MIRLSAFDAPYIRLFSFYPARPRDGAEYREEVVARLRAMADRVRLLPPGAILLLHENEKGIYGDTIARCVDLMKSVGDGFASILDPANFIQCGQTPYPDAYEALQAWIRYVHVKDSLPSGTVTAAGEGASRWPELLERLRADGYDGFFSLEPHLSEAGTHRGFSGPALFRVASQAFQGLLRSMNWERE